jgi:hypothetical protein
MVTTTGWLLGSLLLPPFSLAASGVAIGILQWVVLQNHIWRGRQWVLASVAGWAAGWAIALVAVPPDIRVLAGAVLGAVVGSSQWLVLRREVHLAGWWIIISALAWATGLGLFPGILTSGVMPGAMTGIAIELLLRYPKQHG